MAGIDIRKALDTSSSTATVFIPDVIDGEVRDYAAIQPMLYNVVTHKPWATNTYWIRKRTGRPTAAWRADGGVLPTADNQTFVKVSKTVKYVYARGEVTGPMQKAAGGAYNALADETEAHVAGLVEKVSTDLVTATGGSNDIEGIIHQVGTAGDGAGAGDDFNYGDGLLDVSLADTAGTGPLELDLDLIDEALDLGKNSADLIITSEAIRRRINSILRANQRFNDRVEVAAGFRVSSYDGIPMVTAPEWSPVDDILFVRRADLRMLVHQDLTFEELAKTRDSIDFMLKAYLGFAVEGRPVHLTGFTTDGSGE